MKKKIKIFMVSIFVLFIFFGSYIYAAEFRNTIYAISSNAIVNFINIFLLSTVLIIYLIIFFIYDRENISTKHVYLRDIPEDLDVELAEYIYGSKVTSKTIWSTFLNLVQKGIYTIKKSENEVGTQTYNIEYIENEILLPDYEKEFVNWINNLMQENGKNIDLLTLNQKIKECKNTNFMDKFTELLKSKKKTLFEPIVRVSKSVTKILIIFYIIILISIIFLAKDIEIGLFAMVLAAFTSGVYSVFFLAMLKKSESRYPLLFIIVHYSLFQLGIFMMFIQNNLLTMFFIYLLSYWLIFYSLVANKKSKSEVEFLSKLKALRKYLNDFSYISNKELDSSIVWGKYYAFAIALNVNKKNKNYLSDGIDSDIFDLYTNY